MTCRAEHGEGSACAGFTLVEILVAMSILAMIGGMVTVFFGQLRKVTELQSVESVQQELDSVTRYLERSLEGALALPVNMNQSRDRFFLSGTSDVVSFVSASRLGVSPASLRTKSIRLIADTEGNTLDMTIKPRRFTRTAEKPLTVTLLEGVETFRFEYLDKAVDSTEPVWLDNWERERQLPAAIRVTITLETQGRTLLGTAIARLTMARPAY